MASPATIISVIGTAASIFGGIKANKEAKKQRQAISQQNVLLKEQEKTRRRAGFMDMLAEKRKNIREQYVLRSKVLAADAGGAGQAESGKLGSLGSMSTMFAGQLGGLETRNQMQDEMSARNQQIGDLGTGINQSQSRQQGWMNFSTMAGGIAGNAEQYGNLFKIPDTPKSTTSGKFAGTGGFNAGPVGGSGRYHMWG
tara:strand:+ start:404 stop:997 length:594 start_codon:yes stop_codon:yes gene_type:complete